MGGLSEGSHGNMLEPAIPSGMKSALGKRRTLQAVQGQRKLKSGAIQHLGPADMGGLSEGSHGNMLEPAIPSGMKSALGERRTLQAVQGQRKLESGAIQHLRQADMGGLSEGSHGNMLEPKVPSGMKSALG